MVARFFLFVLLFSFVFAFVAKWAYIYLKKLWNKDKDGFMDVVEETQFEELKCKSLDSHNMIGSKSNSLCKWCGRTLTQIKEVEKKKELVRR